MTTHIRVGRIERKIKEVDYAIQLCEKDLKEYKAVNKDGTWDYMIFATTGKLAGLKETKEILEKLIGGNVK